MSLRGSVNEERNNSKQQTVGTCCCTSDINYLKLGMLEMEDFCCKF